MLNMSPSTLTRENLATMYKLLRFPHSTAQITFIMHAKNSLYFKTTVDSCYINVTAPYQILGLKTLPVQWYIMHDDVTLVSQQSVYVRLV